MGFSMGFRTHVDGKCKECGQYADKTCDSCGKFVCDEHLVKKKIEHSPNYFIFCKECFKEGKKAKAPFRQHHSPKAQHFHHPY